MNIRFYVELSKNIQNYKSNGRDSNPRVVTLLRDIFASFRSSFLFVTKAQKSKINTHYVEIENLGIDTQEKATVCNMLFPRGMEIFNLQLFQPETKRN